VVRGSECEGNDPKPGWGSCDATWFGHRAVEDMVSHLHLGHPTLVRPRIDDRLFLA
jgi:hypothetical protein